jgi:hypothetical protein
LTVVAALSLAGAILAAALALRDFEAWLAARPRDKSRLD